MVEISILQSVAWLIYLLGTMLVLRDLPLRDFAKDKKTQHLVLGASVSIFALWLFRVGIFEGLDVHFLWLTALTLLLGMRWALISGFMALFASTIAGYDSWQMFGVNGVLGVAAPIICSYLIYSFSFHKLPKHFFIYVFISAFFCGAIIIALKMTLLGGYYVLDGYYDWHTVYENYVRLIPLMLFSEAMLNGMTMTILIIYRPTWVYTFYDKYYLN